jgi:nucleoside-diphosphate-sugar epimerase
VDKLGKRVLLTGASGFVGRAVMRQFHQDSWETIPLVRTASGLPNEQVVDFGHVPLPGILKEIARCDAIVHMATHVDFTPKATMESFISTNVLATTWLSTIARLWDAKLIFLSGTIVFGDSRSITAESKPSPDTTYGYAKRLAEQLLDASGVRATILRSSGIFGYHGPAHLAVNRAIDAAVDEHRAPTLVGTGAAKRNYIFVEDLAAAISLCARAGIDGVHLVSGREINTIKEMVDMIGEVFVPASKITMISGNESTDVTIECSKRLLTGRSFRDALESIREKYPRLS